MSDKIITDFKSPITSEGIRETLKSFMPPGRYIGFDKLSAGSVGGAPIQYKISHETEIKLEDGAMYAALFSPQGLLIYTQDTLEQALPASSSALYQCYQVYAMVSLDLSVPVNSTWSLVVNPTAIEVADYTTIDQQDNLTSPDTQIAVGLLVVPPGISDVSGLVYVPFPQRPFGYETAFDTELAWLAKDNVFTGANSVMPTTATIPDDVQGSQLVCKGTNVWVMGSQSVAFSDFKRYALDGVTAISFPIGTVLNVTFLQAGPMLDNSPFGNIYIPGPELSRPVTVGTYTFIMRDTGRWFVIAGFNDLFMSKVDKKPKQWLNLPVDPSKLSSWCAAMAFQYYFDALGDLHLKGGFTIAAPESSGFLDVTPFNTLYLPGAYSETFIQCLKETTVQSGNSPILRFADGKLYGTSGTAGASSGDLTFTVPEVIITSN